MLSITLTRNESFDPLSVIEQATRQAVAQQIAREHTDPDNPQALTFRYEKAGVGTGSQRYCRSDQLSTFMRWEQQSLPYTDSRGGTRLRPRTTYRYKLRVTPRQSATLKRWAGAGRWVWNRALALQKQRLDDGLPVQSHAKMCAGS